MFFRAFALVLLLVVPIQNASLADRSDGRSLGMAITTPQRGDYVTALSLAVDAGVTRVPLSFSWRNLEPEPGIYDDRSLAIAALLFPAVGVSIDLAISPTAGSDLALPRDLRERSFDDPEVIQRYLALLDHVLGILEGADVRTLLIGVEIDLAFGDDIDAWDAFATFAAQISQSVHERWPAIDIGVQSSTSSRIVHPDYWTAIDQVSDIIATSYYPIDGLKVRDPDTIGDDFATLVALYPDRPIHIVETGFPSSAAIGSSQETQAQFIRALFAAWDDFSQQIRSITIWTQFDYAPQELDDLRRHGDRRVDRYIELVGSVGLREWTEDGPPKLAWDALIQETSSRDWRP